VNGVQLRELGPADIQGTGQRAVLGAFDAGVDLRDPQAAGRQRLVEGRAARERPGELRPFEAEAGDLVEDGQRLDGRRQLGEVVVGPQDVDDPDLGPGGWRARASRRTPRSR
jgi:hypothetical protein